MKKIIIMSLLSIAAFVGMTSAAGALTATGGAVNVIYHGSGGRAIGCAGAGGADQAICVDDPVPSSSSTDIALLSR